jgi:hypothetical protein
MFIRRARTRNQSTGEAYFTHRLVASQRAGKPVRQVTLLNLGRQFDLPQPDWPRLCARIEALLAAQPGLLAEAKPIETLAQRYAARLTADRPAARAAIPRATARAAIPRAGPRLSQDTKAAPSPGPAEPPADFAEVDLTSLQLTRPCSAGVEAVGLAAIGWIGLTPILQSLGFNGVQRAAVAASLIGRMAAPGSELATWQWVRGRRALGDQRFVGAPAIGWRHANVPDREASQAGETRGNGSTPTSSPCRWFASTASPTCCCVTATPSRPRCSPASRTCSPCQQRSRSTT